MFEDTSKNSQQFYGTLFDIDIFDLIQFFSSFKYSALISLYFDESKKHGRIFILKGDVYNAVFEELNGENAFTQMLIAKTGRFNVDPITSLPSQNINTSTINLLFEVAKKKDEIEIKKANKINKEIQNISETITPDLSIKELINFSELLDIGSKFLEQGDFINAELAWKLAYMINPNDRELLKDLKLLQSKINRYIIMDGFKGKRDWNNTDPQ